MSRIVLSLLVDNTAGVLSRVAGLFSRRGYNIESLTVGVTADPRYSRMTVVSLGDHQVLEQIQKQLGKLEDVHDIKELRAGAGARVYSLDETGELGKFLEENQSSGVSLSAENLADLKKQLSSFCLSYNDQRFESVYDAKYSLQASVAEYMNFNALGDMDAQLQAQGINYKQISTPQPGIISYMTDSFEGVAPEEVTADSFDRSQYTRQVGRAGEMIEAGTVT